ncbi:MAG TPA: ABC transporter substrate-binding protein [Gemmatimonadaceae bacterium]|jgi:branched-chain amino acid transport system substrate-binding protein
MQLRRALLVPLSVVLAACGHAEPKELRVAVLAPGGDFWAVAAGLPSLQGARMAADEVNGGDGVLIGGDRYRLVVVEKSYLAGASTAVAAAREAIERDRVHFIVGPGISDHALAVAAVAESAGVPMLSPMSSSPLLTAHRRFVSRLALLDDAQGMILARFAHSELKLQRAAILQDSSISSARSIADFFLRTFVASGGEVTGIESYATADSGDFRPKLKRLLATNPQALLLPNYISADSVQLRVARSLGFRGAFLGSDMWDARTLRRVPDAVGAYLVHQWNPASPAPMAQRFVRAYMQQHGSEPRTTAAATYDAIRLVAEAARRAGSLDGGLLTDTLRTFGRFAGAMATYRFTGSGDPKRGGVLVRLGVQRDSVFAFMDVP